jgi:hypothetical protein
MTKGSRSSLKLRLPESGYLIEWFSTIEGRVIEFLSVPHKGGELILKVPYFADDIAVRIIKKD